MVQSYAVALKLTSKDASRILRSTLRIAAPNDDIHVLCILLQETGSTVHRKVSQDQLRQRFEGLLAGRRHRLHIVRVVHPDPESRSAGHHIARALCAKASVLGSSALVVGGQPRPSASGALRSSLVADAVRRHARCPVVLASSTYTVLPRALPPIAEEPCAAEALPGAFARCCSLAQQPPAAPSRPKGSEGGKCTRACCGDVQYPGQGRGQARHTVHLAASPAAS